METDIYVFSDFGGGLNDQNTSVSDWQTAIEIATEGWKLTGHTRIFVYDGITPLDIIAGGRQLAATFPYLGEQGGETKRIVIHVIDPGVGNTSPHPRALVLRKDGTLFIGPDNGTLSLACPPGSIATMYEIDSKPIGKLTGIDLEIGGTFHGRDLFAVAAYLLAAEQVTLQDIGIRYLEPELKFRIPFEKNSKPVQFQEVSTTRWNIQFKNSSESNLFSHAYFLTIVQSPFFAKKIAPQLFFVEHVGLSVAIFNRKTKNLYVGPNNGIGTSFFKGFSSKNVVAYSLHPSVYQKIRTAKSPNDAFEWFRTQIPLSSLVSIDLLARIDERSNNLRTMKGQIWIDAYGNMKTTLDSETLLNSFSLGFTNIAVTLNGITKRVQFARSFTEVAIGEPFIYVGSSGTIGPNPRRSRRYIELSCNGSKGTFGVDLFVNKNKPVTGQEIVFRFTKP